MTFRVMGRVAVFACAVVLATSAGAATFTVDDTGVAVDAVPGDGVCDDGRFGICTLTAAIQEANALAGADAITLPAGSYLLSSPFSTDADGSHGLPPVTSAITIDGAGAPTTVVERMGPTTLRLLTVDGGGVLVLNGVSLVAGDAGGFDGGGLLVRGGAATFTNVIVSGNAGTAVLVQSGSSFTASGGSFQNNTGVNGGAIRGEVADVVVSGAAFVSNQASNRGGAMYLDGAAATTLSIVEGLFTDNTAVEAGGGIWAGTDPRLGVTRSTFDGNHGGDAGGAIAADAGVVRLENSTVSGNDAVTGGGLAAFGGAPVFELASVTITGNQAGDTGGGLAGAGQLRNTILAGNTAVSGGADCSGAGAVVSQGYDVVGTVTGCAWTPGVGDQTGTDMSPLDPVLGPLDDNGGPTPTHALQSGSPAGEAGNPAGCVGTDGVTALATDQRGDPRVVDGDGDTIARCDVGAYEAPPGTFTTTTTSTIPGSTTTTIATTSTSSTLGTTTTSSSTTTSTPTTSSSTTTVATTSTTTTTAPGFARACVGAGLFSTTSGPQTLVPHGVDDLTVAAPRVVWQTFATCGAGQDSARIERIALQCGGVRRIFDANPVTRGGCMPYRTRSTVVADGSYVYWLDETGLRRLSLDANVGDEPTLLSISLPQPVAGLRAQLALHGGGHLVVAVPTGPSTSFPSGQFSLVDRQTGVATLLGSNPVHPTDMGLSSDGALVYWRNYTDQLLELDVQKVLDGASGSVRVIASDVQSFAAEGARLVCITPTICLPFRTVFFASGPSVFRHDVATRTTDPTPVFTSTDPVAVVTGVATTASNVFLFETRDASGGMATVRLMRAGRTAGNVQQDLLHEWTGLTVANRPTELTTAALPLGSFLYWHRRGQLQRLPANAETLPIADLRITGLEVTQAVQTIGESVPLIRDKDTWVRLHVASDGVPVAGVTALLYGSWNDPLSPPGAGGPLVPVGPTGKYLTVQTVPDRDDVNHTFVFKLPKEWTRHVTLQLQAVLNPNQYPPEPSYGNNQHVEGPFAFQTSKRLEVQFVAWQYQKMIGATLKTYQPDYLDDILATFRHIRHVFPLATTPGMRWSPAPGFRPGLQWVFDETLDERVERTHPSCKKLYPPPQPGDPPDVWQQKKDEQPLCASYYTNKRMTALRYEPCSGLASPAWQNCILQQLDLFYYGMIDDGLGFVRGQAWSAAKVSSGPTGPPSASHWDKDTTYGDWYAAHEIAHTLGRHHPAQGTWCGHDAGDPSYPYPGALIGNLFVFPAQRLAGFDGGTTLFGIPPTVYTAKIWTDFMSYCSSNWISDYNYEAILAKLGGVASLSPTRAGAPGASLGEHLLVTGSVGAAGDVGTLDEAVLVPDAPPGVGPTVPGDWTIELRDGSGGVLAAQAFTPSVASDDGVHPFEEAVPFVSGTRTIALLGPGAALLDAVAVSANPPVVSDLALVPPPSGPLTGTATLAWTASDPDGDALTASVYASRDGGGTFQAVVLGIATSGTELDTEVLGGGPTIFRVVVSDGVRSAQADTASVVVASKPPVPLIEAPGDGERFGFGALIALTGTAFDFQEDVADDDLAWSVDGEAVGTGPEVEVEDLAVGEHVVTLGATNGDGLSAETSVTIVVDDDLELPGPIPSVTPTQVSFHVPVGATELQVETLGVTNAGAGDFDWSAASDVPWLEVTPAGGAVPGTLTLVADPSGLVSGELRAATVTITATVPGEEPDPILLTVPVTIAAGNALAAASQTGGEVTTTTTTTLPICLPPDCDDGDACTTDTCVADVGCTNAPLSGIAFARCLCGTLPDACAAETIPDGVARKSAKACTALDAAEASAGKRQRKLLGKTQRLLKKACKKAARASTGRRPKLGAECAEALSALLCEQRTRTIAARDG